MNKQEILNRCPSFIELVDALPRDVAANHQEAIMAIASFICDVRSHSPTSDANIRFEILAKAFLHDTGMMAPGKDIPPAMNPAYNEADRLQAWRKWLKENDIPEPPAPDALVEDLEMAKNHAEILQQQFCCYGTKHGDGGHCDCKFIVGNRGGEKTGCAEARSIIQLLTKALAAHEKAVR